MKVSELIKKLQDFPPDVDVYVPFENCGVDDITKIEAVVVKRYENSMREYHCGEHESIFQINPIKFKIEKHEINILDLIKMEPGYSIGVLIYWR